MDTLSLTKEARIYNGEKTISLTSDAGKTGQPVVKQRRQWHPTPVLLPGKSHGMEEPGRL